ncbi:hypothetical protein F5Y16DRAFT_396189 [Xylariaceae sp. FL0255]|nr:hypothetical protein F5Y16DRAFT_396189 [Xylariaceae sp. FL0255]
MEYKSKKSKSKSKKSRAPPRADSDDASNRSDAGRVEGNAPSEQPDLAALRSMLANEDRSVEHAIDDEASEMDSDEAEQAREQHQGRKTRFEGHEEEGEQEEEDDNEDEDDNRQGQIHQGFRLRQDAPQMQNRRAKKYHLSSDSSEGGAPLYPNGRPANASAHQEAATTHKQEPATDSDEEKALSGAGQNLKMDFSVSDPYNRQRIPTSIPPGVYGSTRRGDFEAMPQVTPTRLPSYNNMGAYTGGSANSNRNRQSNVGLPIPGGGMWHPNPNGTPSAQGGQRPDFVPQETEASATAYAHGYIQFVTQLLNSSPGITSKAAEDVHRYTTLASQCFTRACGLLRDHRDSLQDDLKLSRERHLRLAAETDNLRISFSELQAKLNQSLAREKSTKNELRESTLTANDLRFQLETLEREANKFKNYHEIVIQKYKDQDEKHFKTITALEDELRSLRLDAANFSSPIAPESENNVPSPKEEESGSPLAKSAKKKTGFKPNPNAPAWAPSGSTPHSGGARLAKSESSGDSNDVILYTGRANQAKNKQSAPADQSMAMTPYRAPARPVQDDGIQTPFGIVFGGYPTVEQNSQIPGAKKIAKDKPIWDIADVQRAMTHLYNLCRGVINNHHTRKPTKVAYADLPIADHNTWKYICGATYANFEQASEHTAFLLKNDRYVNCLLKRLCVEYLMKKIMTPQIFIGFRNKYNEHLSDLQHTMANHAEMRSTPIRTRQRVTQDHARLIRAIAADPDISKYRKYIVEQHGTMLATFLEPFRSRDALAAKVHSDFCLMVAACWDISIKVWSSGQTLHYVFPECASKYVEGTQEPLNWPEVVPKIEKLLDSQYRLSLVITPTMTLRDGRDEKELQCHGVHKAQVLVMK